MTIPYQGTTRRKREARKFWLKVLDDYTNGLTAGQIAKKYINPLTGKHYIRPSIYSILRNLRSMSPEELQQLRAEAEE